MINLRKRDLNKIIVIGDKVLLKPTTPIERTESGLYLPQGFHKKEELYTAYVVKVGPGYPIPAIQDVDEPWKRRSEHVNYVPLQPQEGDLAVYLQSSAFAVTFNSEDYVIVPQNAILMLIREEE